MKAVLILFCALVSTSVAYKSYRDYKVFLVRPSDSKQMAALRAIQLEAGVDFWDSIHRTPSPLNVMVSPVKIIQFENELEKWKIDYQIIVDDVEKY